MICLFDVLHRAAGLASHPFVLTRGSLLLSVSKGPDATATIVWLRIVDGIGCKGLLCVRVWIFGTERHGISQGLSCPVLPSFLLLLSVNRAKCVCGAAIWATAAIQSSGIGGGQARPPPVGLVPFPTAFDH